MSSNTFYQFVARHYHQPITFDPDADDQLVKSLLPIDRFKAEITAAVSADASLATADPTTLLVIKLLDYFKTQFFSWVDALSCDQCNIPCRLFTVQTPSEDLSELLYLASSTEIYRCPTCSTFYRFPRYNDPRKLLTTRRGRCGEWANTFAYILHCLQIPTRLVFCTSDHVWIEFYAATERRWIHADPCENEYDNPLLYEVGWGKKIDLVLARGAEELRDVTWRYTARWMVTAAERKRQFSETRMLEVLEQWNGQLQKDLSCERRGELAKRWIEELVEFIRLPGQEVLQPSKATTGRTSGSIAWRLSRAETSCTTNPNTHRFQIAPIPGTTIISYDCNLDRYQIDVPQGATASYNSLDKWSTGVARTVNVFRNVEADWKMCYLARKKSSMPEDEGLITWCFELQAAATDPGSTVKWTSIEVLIRGECFQSGSVELNFTAGAQLKRRFTLNQRLTITRKEAEAVGETNLTVFEISAKLIGGNGDVAWQHGQLFRQKWNQGGPREDMMLVAVKFA